MVNKRLELGLVQKSIVVVVKACIDLPHQVAKRQEVKLIGLVETDQEFNVFDTFRSQVFVDHLEGSGDRRFGRLLFDVTQNDLFLEVLGLVQVLFIEPLVEVLQACRPVGLQHFGHVLVRFYLIHGTHFVSIEFSPHLLRHSFQIQPLLLLF